MISSRAVSQRRTVVDTRCSRAGAPLARCHHSPLGDVPRHPWGVTWFAHCLRAPGQAGQRELGHVGQLKRKSSTLAGAGRKNAQQGPKVAGDLKKVSVRSRRCEVTTVSIPNLTSAEG